MAQIEIKPDCGNAPRKIFLADLNAAFAKGDMSYLTDNIPDDITLEIIGISTVHGKENVLSELIKGPYWKLKKLTIDTIITHGREASVNGQIILADNSKFSFCDIYKFKGAGGPIIKEILRYIIKNKSERG